jgi:tripartite-type tricarboxylate transporter receptor subunit TctC
MFKKPVRKLLGSALIAATMFGAASANAEVSFEGQTITVVIPFKEGGGTSRVFRFFQPYLSKYLPGNPVVQLQNIPGGGTIKGANFFHNNQNPDGTFLFATSSSVNIQQATGNDLAEFDLSEYRPVMSLATTTHWFTRSDLASGPNDISGLQARELSLFPFKTASSADLFHLWIYDKLGINARPIPGLSTSAGFQSFLRGELQMASQGTSGFLSKVVPEIDAGNAVQFMTLGVLQADGSVAHPSYSSDAITFPEMYEKVNGMPLEGYRRKLGPSIQGPVLADRHAARCCGCLAWGNPEDDRRSSVHRGCAG